MIGLAAFVSVFYCSCFSTFIQETTATIVFRLLDRVVAAELIPNAIAKYIAPYMAHHSLHRDTMLLQYVEVKYITWGIDHFTVVCLVAFPLN